MRHYPSQSPSNNQGFTIVEVMIVLGIAGLIMLSIFLAIPALLRNSRNNARKQDVSALLDAVSSFALNNSGRMPDSGSNLLQAESVKLSYYSPSITYDSIPGGPGIGILLQASTAPETNNNTDTALIYNYRKCDANNPGATTSQGAGYRDIVALYGIETGGATSASKCLQL